MQIEEPFSILPLGAPLPQRRCMPFSRMHCEAPQLNSACAAMFVTSFCCLECIQSLL